jgi:DNA-binding NtrC family response regulator
MDVRSQNEASMPRILLIEDDADVRAVFEHILLAEGYEVDATGTITGGRGLLASRRYDLVLSDGRLPDGTGMELADQAAERDVPALIITGYAFILNELSREKEKYDFLLKPMRPPELVDAVNRALRRGRCDAA